MRQATVALLAVPILFVVRAGATLRRSSLVRVGLAMGLAIALSIGVNGTGRPATTVATPPRPIVPLTQTAFTTTFSTHRGLVEPVTIVFTTPMDPASVAAAVTVEPATPVALTWDATQTILTVAPRQRWAVGQLHTVTVQAGALGRSGQPLLRPARAVFLTRDATTGSADATVRIGSRVAPSTSFRVSFERPVDPATVRTAIRLDPPTLGTVQADMRGEGQIRFLFVPSAPLLPDVQYRLIVAGVRDVDGAPLDTINLTVRTINGPSVVRFRPRADSYDVARDAAISVRFSEAMDRRSTARAFTAWVGTKAIAGKIRWAESDTVLVFTPTAPLPKGAKVTMRVGAGATNAKGIAMGVPDQGVFHTVGARAAATVTQNVVRATGGTGSTGGSTGGGGSAVGGGSWAAVETYYLGLMNCTRTGGWVTSSGACSSPGGRAVAALKLDSGISSKVSRPYAKKLAVGADCSHFMGGNPGDRLSRAGYSSYRWAENLGCRSGAARSAVLGSHLFFQAEKSSNGGHYVNLMNAAYDRVGIGVWVSGGRVRLVIDFYHP